MTGKRRTWQLLGCTLLLACGAEDPRPEPRVVQNSNDAVTDVSEFIDSAIPQAVAGDGGWNFQQSAMADLTGDGTPERVVLTARVEVYRGRPAWDDGQPWQVYVEVADSSRTYLYSQRLQLGTLTMRITQPEPNRLPSILMLEHLPDRMRVIESSYPEANGRPSAVVRFERALNPQGELASPQLP
ncbi:MAG: hypothetical protein GEU90_18025 [Gemmatimonas sp.]|nr:hypothetical protein [Gemmatimonas sp.]